MKILFYFQAGQHGSLTGHSKEYILCISFYLFYTLLNVLNSFIIHGLPYRLTSNFIQVGQALWEQ